VDGLTGLRLSENGEISQVRVGGTVAALNEDILRYKRYQKSLFAATVPGGKQAFSVTINATDLSVKHR